MRKASAFAGAASDSGRHNKCRKARVTGRGLERDDCALGDPVVLVQDSLHLAELDPEAADLDLVVDASEELQAPIRPRTGKVTAAIQAAGAERICEEALGSELRDG